MQYYKKLCAICMVLFLNGAIVLGAPPLTSEQRASAAEPESLFVPTPGEIFAAIDKQVKANWFSMNRDNVPQTDTRPQIALGLGTLVTDGYIAIEAQDGQGVKNIGKDILNLAKKLNVSQSLLARGNSLNEFAEKNQWNTLKEELDATQNEVKLTMAEQKDQDLIILVTIGAWVRGLQVATTIVTSNYTPSVAKLLRQPAIVDYLLQQIRLLPPRIQSDETLITIANQLSRAQPLVSLPQGEPLSLEAVKQLNQIATEMVDKILASPKTP